MITDIEKSTLKKALLNLKAESTNTEEETYPKESILKTSGELSMYDNHPADMGTALFEREKDIALHEHAESTLGKIDVALKAMKDGTYGKCEVCNKDIPFERLEAVPYTTFCIDHAELVEQSVEEDIAVNEVENPFESTKDPSAIDYENSFQEVAEFGTSDASSDFKDPENPTYYNDDGEQSQVDKIVGNSVTDNTEDE